ncbi:hypothetical protein [Dyadobacter sp. Leaf189]|uniref:hypothetical protein n=1 Tax=Dyadobacter sp. Leaf189 TaxID=1736295 RepID=UPI000700AE95|nr:hypothetical protein [Dyadobacter sp. Leaf189]KQS33478.1 hypothetical protein ASG33_05230 [Dyadobacter sp. Leaf189]
MKKFALMITAVCSIVSCQNNSIDKRDEGIAYKETITINDVPKATLTFFAYGDSRCPEGANCIWAGNAQVDLLLSGITTEGRINEHVKMCLGGCQFSRKDSVKTSYVLIDTLDKNFAGQQYRFILSALEPGPSLDSVRQKEVRRIKLKVEKL